MKEVIGQDVIGIDAPQDRSELVIATIDENNEIHKTRFANDDGTTISVDYSHVTISLIHDQDTDHVSIGELEELNKIEGGFEVVGDFGVIRIQCKKYMPWK